MWPVYSLLFSFLTQYLHPYKTRSYRKAVQAIRKIGRECIQRRISAIENGEQVPNDILTQIIKVTSELRMSDALPKEIPVCLQKPSMDILMKPV